MPVTPLDHEIVALCKACHDDPLRFVLKAYPWGERGQLERDQGPDRWQAEFLNWLGEQTQQRGFDGFHAVTPIRRAVSSGHGIGKSVLVAFIVDWIMSTRPHSQGTVTANTITQLQTKTWAAITRWTKLCLTGHWFTINSDRMYYTAYKESWFCAPQSSKEENSEAFAGQHAKDATSFYIFDEASAIPDKIYEVAAGGLTDGSPMMFIFGNPTRSFGQFYKNAFGANRDRWDPLIIDSRDTRFANKEFIDDMLAEYGGEDSDGFRVRVRGLPPRASDAQYIDLERVVAAQSRDWIAPLDDEPLVCALDVARGGGDRAVFRFRRGLDGRSVPPISLPGEQTRDSMRLVTVAADVLERDYQGRRIATLFVDGTGVGGPIVDRLRQLGHRNVVEVQFGAESPNPKLANLRAYMWSEMREWLLRGCIDRDARLEQDLTGPGYAHDKRDRLVLESKEHMKSRGVDSPDDGDALAMTFAAKVASPGVRERRRTTFTVLTGGQMSWAG